MLLGDDRGGAADGEGAGGGGVDGLGRDGLLGLRNLWGGWRERSLKRMLSRLGESRSVEECSVMIGQFDVNGDGVLSFDEFKLMML
ncbi:putative calcium-binding protein CML40 [Vitis vinifera]|uniref:Putative calcium-binding protein CML40 n=1 Tax=Vitis vinifera TaxID=29760 RepID=A0A438FS71_VITVI|nr:putative calcium-binding protein CML40 [Vitis vinifera]